MASEVDNKKAVTVLESTKERCRLCYHSFVKLINHMLKQHDDRLHDEIREVLGHYCSDYLLDLPEGVVEARTFVCKVKWSDQSIIHVSAEKISRTYKFREYIRSINQGQCPDFTKENLNQFLRQFRPTTHGDKSLIHVDKKRSRTHRPSDAKAKKRSRTIEPRAAVSDDCQIVEHSQPSQSNPSQRCARSSNTTFINNLSRDTIREQRQQQQTDNEFSFVSPHPSIDDISFNHRRRNRAEMATFAERLQSTINFPAFTFEDALSALDNDLGMTPVSQDFDDATENYSLNVPVNNNSTLMDALNNSGNPPLNLSTPRATANITVTGTPLPQFNLLHRPQPEASDGINVSHEDNGRHRRRTPAPSHKSKEAQEPAVPQLVRPSVNQPQNTSSSESHVPAIQSSSGASPSYIVAVPENPPSTSVFANPRRSPSTSVHANQRRSPSIVENLPPITLPNQQQSINFSPNANSSTTVASSENQSTNMPFPVLDEINRLLCDPTRPIIIDDESLVDLQHVIHGDYNEYKEVAPQLSMCYPKGPISFIKCQKLHSYIQNGGTPLRYFFMEPSLDTVQIIIANGFSIFQHEILNKLALNPMVKLENERCLGEVFEYITWWKKEMMNLSYTVSSNYLTSKMQEVPIRSFSSRISCYPFSPSFKRISLSFSKFHHRITRPFVLSGTNVQVKSLMMIFVGQYGNLSSDSNIEVQPTRFHRNLDDVFSALKVYDSSKNKKFELKFYRNLGNGVFLYEFPEKINIDIDFTVRFKVDFVDFGAIDDGYCLFAQIVNCLSVNH